MLRNYFRAIYSDNGVLTDASNALQADGDGLAKILTPAEDYFYIGQMMPFNNVFAWLEVLSTATTAVLTVQYWSGSAWVDAVDTLDGTKGFTRNGCIQFVPDKNKIWTQVFDTSEAPTAFGLTSLKIYNLFWIRIKSSVELSATAKFKRLTYAFCLTTDLKTHMPDINSYLDAWGGSLKTDWIEQIIAASEQVVIDLKARGMVLTAGQILLLDDVSYATQMKTLANIAVPLGPNFETQRTEWLKEYKAALSIKRFTLDVNQTGAVELGEQGLSVGQLVR